jgi:hypothetical protein
MTCPAVPIFPELFGTMLCTACVVPRPYLLLPVFDRLRYRRDDRRVFLYAFDLIELTAMICGANRSSAARCC